MFAYKDKPAQALKSHGCPMHAYYSGLVCVLALTA
jgi:hypothetical protein